MTMIGNGASAHWVMVARHSAGISSIVDLKSRDLIVGATSPVGDAYLLTRAVKEVLGLDHLKIITGYGGIREVAAAVERGEISGCVMDLEDILALRPQWLLNGDIDVLAQLSPSKMAGALVEVPLVSDFVTSDESKKVLDVIFATTMLARPIIAPPQIPQARTKALREAFSATLADPDFLTEAARIKIAPDPISGERMQEIVHDTYALPSAILSKVHSILSD